VDLQIMPIFSEHRRPARLFTSLKTEYLAIGAIYVPTVCLHLTRGVSSFVVRLPPRDLVGIFPRGALGWQRRAR
jgi:hypothetical protein